jgi:ATP-binding cassette subfamily B protein
MEQKISTGRVLRFAFSQWNEYRLWVAGMVLIALAVTAADVLVPVLAGRFIDLLAGSSDRDFGMAMRSLAQILGLVAVGHVLRNQNFRIMVGLGTRSMRNIAERAFWRVQRFSTDWHANAFAGATVRKITRGMWAFDNFGDLIVFSLGPTLLVLVGTTILLASRWPILGLACLIGIAVFIGVTLLLSLGWVSPAMRLSNAEDSAIGATLADSVTCNATVKSFGAEEREQARLHANMDRWYEKTVLGWHRAVKSALLQNMISLALQATVLSLATWLWSTGQASAGDVAYVLTSYMVVHAHLREVGSQVRQLQRSLNDMEDVVQISLQPLGVEDRAGAGELAVSAGGIEFDTVRFRYAGQSAALYEGFSLSIRPGEKIALVGQSGSGKSTFVKLIQRLYDIDGGHICIDGQDIAAVTQESLRRQIALVPQEPILFHRSLADNIAYGRPNATAAEIEAAARKAHAHIFIERLPLGYATLVGERGVKLSGGERQRVALARAILADQPILVLDEATSSLDSVSEALIQDAVETLIRDRTTILIAHRLSTIQRVDRILVFEAGCIVEQGTHAELLERPDGAYRRLYRLQALGLEAAKPAAA